MKKILKISIVFLLSISQNVFAQSPWTKEKGKAYIQVGFSGLFYDLYADKNGKKIELNQNVSDVTLQAYSEYGITSKLTANLIVPYKTISVENTLIKQISSHSGIGNISLGLKYKLSDNDWKISTGITYSANSISKNKTNFLTTGFNAATILPYLSIGTSHDKWYYYGNLGYGYMDNDFSDYLRFNGEVGYNIIPKGHIIFALETRNIISKEDAFTKDPYSNFSSSDRQNYNAFGLKLNYEFAKDKFGANFSGFGAFDNKNAPLAPSLNFGIYAKL
jgi:hypothetical protein